MVERNQKDLEVMILEHQAEKEKTVMREIAFHCAPVIAGMKPSNLLILSGTGDCRIGAALQNTGVSCMCLSAGRENTMCFLYRKEYLEALVAGKENRSFLVKYGYREFTLEKVLARLRDRFLNYQSGAGEFPHEMGLLLGYPLADVNGFIENQGKNYLLSGYWKVYEDPDGARKLFRVYTKTREEMVNAVDSGKLLWQIEKQYQRRKSLKISAG